MKTFGPLFYGKNPPIEPLSLASKHGPARVFSIRPHFYLAMTCYRVTWWPACLTISSSARALPAACWLTVSRMRTKTRSFYSKLAVLTISERSGFRQHPDCLRYLRHPVPQPVGRLTLNTEAVCTTAPQNEQVGPKRSGWSIWLGIGICYGGLSQ